MSDTHTVTHRRDGHAAWIILAAMIAASVIGWTLFITNMRTTHPDTYQPILPENYPACATEDAQGPCYWDADTMGNGHGMSFRIHPDGTVEYTGVGTHSTDPDPIQPYDDSLTPTEQAWFMTH